MANEKISDDQLRHLCDEIAARDGVVRINVLREAAGGGSYSRLARVVDAWGRERGRPAPRPLRLRRRGAELMRPAAAPGHLEAEGDPVASSLREENEILWRMLREEREARLAEIDRLNRLMDLMSRHVQAGGGLDQHR
jgi:hypothetical protein